MAQTGKKICVRCGRAVIKNRDEFETFEKMHWLCFHLEYEHKADPDEACDDPSCPWWQLQILKEKIRKLGHDPQKIIESAIDKQWEKAL
jgi:hypothetical protein